MRKHWLFTVIAVTTFTGFSSCSDDDDVPTPPETPVTGAYILNAFQSGLLILSGVFNCPVQNHQ